jgi:ankyrin repeat protein
VKGNPSAITRADNRGMMPLHIACQHHESVSVIEYLINLDPTSVRARDLDDNTSLHHACRGANHAIITVLLEKYGESISKRNAHNQLPIHLLLESDAAKVGDRDSIEYTESVYRLIRGYPVIN